MQLTACPLFDDEDRPLYQLLQVEDLSARAGAEAELLASQDPLTGVLTGEALHERMVDVLDRARRLDTTGVVLVCDLERLTRAAGLSDEDAVRQAVADTLGSTLRNSDLIARIGENRFAVVAEEVRPEHAVNVARRMSEALQQSATGIDIGVSVLSSDVSIRTCCSSGPPRRCWSPGGRRELPAVLPRCRADRPDRPRGALRRPRLERLTAGTGQAGQPDLGHWS